MGGEHRWDIDTKWRIEQLGKQLFHDSKVHCANMGPIWGRQDPDGPHAGPMNFAIWVA